MSTLAEISLTHFHVYQFVFIDNQASVFNNISVTGWLPLGGIGPPLTATAGFLYEDNIIKRGKHHGFD